MVSGCLPTTADRLVADTAYVSSLVDLVSVLISADGK